MLRVEFNGVFYFYAGGVVRTRKLGNSDLELTTVGLGTWAMGGPGDLGWGPQNDADSIKTIFEALDTGINWIDTAPLYGSGHSEKIVGRAVRQMKQAPIISTKCGLLWDDKSERIFCLKKDSIKKECDDSLKRLGIDVIDLYQIHWPIPDEDVEEALEAIAGCMEKGKVRYMGVSNFSIEQIRRAQKICPVTSVQPSYSMLIRDIEDELMPFCKDNNIGIIAYSPMCRGLLTGKFNAARVAKLSAGDHRKSRPYFQEPKLSRTFELLEKLKPIAGRNNRTLAQLAVAWVLRREEITAAIVGARRPGQITETAPAGDWRLSIEDIEEIEELLENYK